MLDAASRSDDRRDEVAGELVLHSQRLAGAPGEAWMFGSVARKSLHARRGSRRAARPGNVPARRRGKDEVGEVLAGKGRRIRDAAEGAVLVGEDAGVALAVAAAQAGLAIAEDIPGKAASGAKYQMWLLEKLTGSPPAGRC